MTTRYITCTECDGEGSLYASKYGGNDPDVWRTGECTKCRGTGDQPCSKPKCNYRASAEFEGDFLCLDHYNEAVADALGSGGIR